MKKLKKIDYIMYGSILAMLNIVIGFVIGLTDKFDKTSNLISIIVSILPFILVFIGIFKKEQKKEIHTKKTTVVLLSVILFSLILSRNIVLELVLYGYRAFNDFSAFLIWLIPQTFMSYYSVLTYIVFIYGMCLNRTKKKTVKEETKRKKIWITILAINLIVFIATLIYCASAGEWFIFSIFFGSPILIVSFILIIISIIKIKK